MIGKLIGGDGDILLKDAKGLPAEQHKEGFFLEQTFPGVKYLNISAPQQSDGPQLLQWLKCEYPFTPKNPSISKLSTKQQTQKDMGLGTVENMILHAK